jgi:hypothetical protein
MDLYNILGAAAEKAINVGVRLLGRTLDLTDFPWLSGPVGLPGALGTQLYAQIAAEENLEQRRSETAGLLADFASLHSDRFDSASVDPQVRDFYENTAAYELEAWSDVSFLARPALWGLVTLVSRRMDQLVFPLSPLELSGGMSSEVVELVKRGSGERVYTGWRRTLLSNRSIIYAGLYSTAVPPNYGRACVRVTFPVPRGNATVILRPEAGPDGSLWLVSAGKKFGDPGFYRVVRTAPKQWSVRYMPLRERFHVFVHTDGVLRTEHTISVPGIKVLTLHYKMRRPKLPLPATEAVETTSRI